jgi:acetyl-CoA C-acetyltransferase
LERLVRNAAEKIPRRQKTIVAAKHTAIGKFAGSLSKLSVPDIGVAVIGASGCRELVSLLHEMVKRDAKRGLASLCIGGGMGVALTLER